MKNDDFAPVTLKKMGKLGDFSRKKGDFMEVQISPKWEKKGTVLTLNIWGKLRVSPFHPEKMVIWRAKIVILTQQTWWFHRLNHGDPPNMVLWKVLVEYSWVENGCVESAKCLQESPMSSWAIPRHGQSSPRPGTKTVITKKSWPIMTGWWCWPSWKIWVNGKDYPLANCHITMESHHSSW